MKIAIVGTGNVAIDNYLPWLHKQKRFTFGYYNRTQEKALKAVEKFGGTAFSSLRELAAWQPDVTFILTSEKIRYEVAKELLGYGLKRVFFEKPLAAANGQAHVSEEDFERGKELLKLAAEKGTETAMMFNYRFFDQSLAAKKIVAERNFGPLISAMGAIHYACWSHCIDLVHFFGGAMEEITALRGAAEHTGAGMTAPDVVAAFRLEGGATGTLLGTTGMKFQHPLFELMLTFQNGRLHMRDLDGDLEVLDGSRQTHERITLARDGSRWTHYSTSFEKALAAYFETVQAGTPPPVPGRDGLRELQTEAALKRSIAQSRPVLVQKEFPL